MKITNSKLVEKYKAEYERTNGKPSTVIFYCPGWFLVNSQKISKGQLINMLKTLESRPDAIQ